MTLRGPSVASCTTRCDIQKFCISLAKCISGFLWTWKKREGMCLLRRMKWIFKCTGLCFIFKEDVRGPRELIVKLAVPRLGCSPRSVHVRFPLDLLALRRGFFRILRFSLLCIIKQMLRTHLHLHVPLTRKTMWRSLGTFQKQCLFGNRETSDRKELTPRL